MMKVDANHWSLFVKRSHIVKNLYFCITNDINFKCYGYDL